MPIELKTIDACKDEVAKELGYNDWLDVLISCQDKDFLSNIEDEVIKAFALHVLDYAAQEAKLAIKTEHKEPTIEVVEDSITNIKNKIK